MMIRQEAINVWKILASTVFAAENAIQKKNPQVLERLRDNSRTTEERSEEYITAIATEIVSRTSDEELATLD